MMNALDMPLEELIKASKGEGRGGGGPMKPGDRFRRVGGSDYGDTFNGSAAFGPIRRAPFPPSFCSSPYLPVKRGSDGPWKHDLFDAESSIVHYNKHVSGFTTGTRVLITNLDYGVSDADIKELFAEVGDVKWSSVRYDRSGRSEGSAEVLYSRRADAEVAVKRYHGVLLDGKAMHVQIKGTNLPVPSPSGDILYAAPMARGHEKRVPGMMFQASGGITQSSQIFRLGVIHQSAGVGKAIGKEEQEKLRLELDADLERYHAAAKKSSLR